MRPTTFINPNLTRSAWITRFVSPRSLTLRALLFLATSFPKSFLGISKAALSFRAIPAHKDSFHFLIVSKLFFSLYVFFSSSAREMARTHSRDWPRGQFHAAAVLIRVLVDDVA